MGEMCQCANVRMCQCADVPIYLTHFPLSINQSRPSSICIRRGGHTFTFPPSISRPLLPFAHLHICTLAHQHTFTFPPSISGPFFNWHIGTSAHRHIDTLAHSPHFPLSSPHENPRNPRWRSAWQNAHQRSHALGYENRRARSGKRCSLRAVCA